MTPENKKSEITPHARMSRVIGLGVASALVLSSSSVAEHGQHPDAPRATHAAEFNPNDPVRLKARQDFDRLNHDDLYSCKVVKDSVVLGEVLTMDGQGNKIPPLQTFEYTMQVKKGPQWNNYPPAQTASGGEVELTWQEFGSAYDIRNQALNADGRPTQIIGEHAYRSARTTLDDEKRGKFTMQAGIEGNGRHALHLMHKGELVLRDSEKEAAGNKPPQRYLEKDCGVVMITVKNGKVVDFEFKD